MSHYKLIAVSLCFALLGGCASQDIPDPEPTDETYGSEDGADTDAYGGSGLGEGEAIDYDPNAGELGQVVYFEFDSYELRPEDTDIVARHACNWLTTQESASDSRAMPTSAARVNTISA